MRHSGRCRRLVVVLCLAVCAEAVLLLVVWLAAMSVVAVVAAVRVVVVVMLLCTVVLVVVGVAATLYLCRVRPHRLLRMGSQVDAGKVSRTFVELVRGLCRCCPGLCLVVGRSCVCRTRVDSLCRRWFLVVAVRCGDFVNVDVQSGSDAHCAGRCQVVI